MPKNPDPAVGAYSAPPDPIAGNGGRGPQEEGGKRRKGEGRIGVRWGGEG